MSAETALWLNTMTLIGNTLNRGNAWHYRADLQGDEPNHYEGHIPVADLKRRLWPWSPKTSPLNIVTENGDTLNAPGMIAVYRDDTLDLLGTFSDGYVVHDFDEWGVKTLSSIIGDTLGVSSAGLLKGGRQAWVEVSVDESIDTTEGFTFRPSLLFSTSLDGSLATSYRRNITAVVCDNTLGAANAENGPVFKVKHTANSMGKIKDAREALNILEREADTFSAFITTLCQTEVSDTAWRAFLDAHVPMPEDEGRGRTMAANKRAAFVNLWNNDQRVTPWKGTALGVLQADNTYRTHYAGTRGTIRSERNTFDAIKGKTEADDRAVLDTLGKVLASV